jgi:beta-xylosidase
MSISSSLFSALTGFATLVALPCSAATSAAAPWVADQGDGTYKNPILYADYSDPDVIRVGDDFYLTASSFNCVPGLPILHSRDLVNWRIIGHAAERLPKRFDTVQHGNGIWAPSIRHHDGYFWIFVGDPDWGILATRAEDPAGPWEPLRVVKEGKGLIDPCPLWDGEKAYLVHAYAKSRSGKNSIIVCQEMAPDASGIIGDEQIVIDGRGGDHPTIEGPKFYKRNGYYYIFAPAGGVKPGWQVAARAKQPFGPYDARRVLEQGTTKINGPHQGGWVELENGENWFIHFQDRGAYGRVVHLNPVRWVDDWPAMGVDVDGNGVGEPVAASTKPGVRSSTAIETPPTSDAFDGPLGLQWQWQGNPQNDWASLSARPGWLRLRAVEPLPGDLTTACHQLLQKFPAPEFSATTVVDFAPGREEARAGLVVMGLTYAGIVVQRDELGLRIEQISNTQSGAEGDDERHGVVDAPRGPIWLRVTVEPEARCTFSYSTDGKEFAKLGETFTAGPGRWIGAKVGLVCSGDDAHADFDHFTVD